MNYFYDLENKCFLVEGLHTIPKKAIAVNEDVYQTLIDGRAKGAEIIVNGKALEITSVKPSYYHKWDGEKWVLSAEQAEIKRQNEISEMRKRINALRDIKIDGGIYVGAVGKWVDSDGEAERNLIGAKNSFELFDDFEIDWTCADNSILKLNRDALMEIFKALIDAKTRNHANARRHKAAVEQAENPLEYDYSDGWTKTYKDFLNEENQ